MKINILLNNNFFNDHCTYGFAFPIFKSLDLIDSNFYFDILKWPTCWKGGHSYQKNVNTIQIQIFEKCLSYFASIQPKRRNCFL